MFDLLTTLWTHNIFPEKSNVVNSDRQTFFFQFIEKANNQSVAKLIKKQKEQKAKNINKLRKYLLNQFVVLLFFTKYRNKLRFIE
jgi:hypothetical protein